MDDEAQKYIWEGSIPLQIHLHDSEVTIHPSPPPALILAPRIGYLPLLLPHIRPHFSSTLPPGSTGDDSIWFEYKGLPLKWHIPTGVLFDLLCPEPERPWNLTVHFRGYPGNILIPCEGEDSVKWNFINALKEAAYVINGNCKNIMNMSQPDQSDLWRSVLKGNLEAYSKVSSKIKLGIPRDDFTEKSNLDDPLRSPRQGRIPVRLYICSLSEDFNGLEDVPHVDSWDKISYINRSVEYQSEEGKYFTLFDAIKALLPELFEAESLTTEDISKMDVNDSSVDETSTRNLADGEEKLHCPSVFTEIKLIRIQGIEPKFEIPFSWVVNNLINPEHFLHICLYVKSSHANNL